MLRTMNFSIKELGFFLANHSYNHNSFKITILILYLYELGMLYMHAYMPATAYTNEVGSPAPGSHFLRRDVIHKDGPPGINSFLSILLAPAPAKSGLILGSANWTFHP